MQINKTASATSAESSAQLSGSTPPSADAKAAPITGAGKHANRAFPYRKARAAVALAAVVIAVLGAALHLGAGIPCAIGVEQIAAICPVGALEVMLGSKELMLHPLILLGTAVIVILIAGKAFCSWVCPVPWVKRLFRGKKVSDSRINADGNDAQLCDASGDSQAHALDGDAQAHVGAPLMAPARLQQAVTTNDPVVIGDLQQNPAAAPGNTPSTVDPAFSIADELDAVCGGRDGHSCSSCSGCEALKSIGGKRDGVQVDSRHIVLLGALGSAAVFGFPVLCLVCPVGLTFAFLIGLANMFQFNEPSIALLIAPAVLVLEVVFLRKWCTKFCPISALVSLISTGNKTFKPKVNTSACLRSQGIDCHACVEACPEQLDPHTKMIPECSKCGACVEACPARAISIKALSWK